MNILLIDNGTNLLNKLRLLIPGAEVVKKWNNDEISNYDAYDLIVLSGSSLFPLIGNEQKFSKELDIIKNTKKPVIGICFGCELIIKAFGGTLKQVKRIKGLFKVNVVINNTIFGNRKEFIVYKNHSWTMDDLPKEIEILALSGKNAMAIKHKTLPIYGFQFHPEYFTEETYGDEVFLNCLDLLLNESKDF